MGAADSPRYGRLVMIDKSEQPTALQHVLVLRTSTRSKCGLWFDVRSLFGLEYRALPVYFLQRPIASRCTGFL